MDESAVGTLLGLACGDALGRPVEFKSPTTIDEEWGTVEEMEGDGTYGKPAGTITDDTEQALGISRSLVEQEEFNPDDIATRFVDWYESDPFDIGITTRRALSKIAAGIDWETAAETTLTESGPNSGAGNGSIMRCAPIAITGSDGELDQLINASLAQSRITHADTRCTHGSVALNLVIAGYIENRENPVERAIEWLRENHDATSREIFVRGRRVKTSPRPTEKLPNGGYVVDTFETGLTLARRADSFREAVTTAVNLGGDADTIGAVTGAVAGARFGAEEIPDSWEAEIDESDEIRSLATALVDVSL